jgi:uroporphyrinogen-III synthase
MNPIKPVYLFSVSSHPDAIHINSLDITFFKPEIDFSKYDYLIITSKQASRALQQYNREEFITKPALCISTQSAKSFEALGGKVLALGEGYGDTLVSKIEAYPKEMRWLYLRAQEVASDFVAQCRAKGYNIDETVVYKSECSKEIADVNVPEDAVLIFTSPSSVRCFIKNSEIGVKNRVIVIGKSTAKALPKNIQYTISEEKTIDSCLMMLNKG